MKIVIEIPKDRYKEILQDDYIPDGNFRRNMIEAVRNSTLLPEGHGRLIDADDFKKNVCTYQQTGCGSCKHSLCCPEDVPTIIEADKGESEPQEISDRNMKMWEEIFAEEKRRESEDK